MNPDDKQMKEKLKINSGFIVAWKSLIWAESNAYKQENQVGSPTLKEGYCSEGAESCDRMTMSH